MIRQGSILEYDALPTVVPMPNGTFSLMISLGDIESCRTQRLVDFVNEQLQSVQSAHRLVGKCMLMVDGYNDDPRDLSQIEEVRTYFHTFVRECTLLPFLLEPLKEEMSLYLLLTAGGRRITDGGPLMADPTLTDAPTMFSASSTKELHRIMETFILDLGEWLHRHGVATDTKHPLYKAHERSCSALVDVINSEAPLFSVVDGRPSSK